MKTTQNDMIIRHLKDYGSITTWEAIQEYGVTRLKDMGYNIDSKWMYDINRYGEYDVVETIKTTEKYPLSVIDIDKEHPSKFHPTQKPVALLEYLIKTYTNENMTVLDNCMGSGSTCVACKNTNRRYIGIELDDKYFDIGVNRLKEE